MKSEDLLKPGSPAAVAAGCECPIIDNGHGRGYMGDSQRFGFVYTASCPLHGVDADSIEVKEAPAS